VPEQSPLTLGLTPPLLRGIAPTNRRLTQMQGLEMLRRIAQWIDQKVPALHVKITDGVGSMTIYVEVTHGSPT
jgi:hypothetical protein